MTSALALAAFALLCASGPVAAFSRDPERADRIAAALLLAGAALGALAAVLALVSGGDALSLATSLPGGALSVGMDPLSAFFALPVVVVTAACGLYAPAYFPATRHPHEAPRLRVAFGLTCGGLLLVLLARHSLVFLAAWELMAIAAFFAVTAEDREREVREAGFLYLVCTRASTLALFALFAALGSASGSLRLAPLAPGQAPHAIQSGIFVLALVGFGLKAGLVPLHVWLPPAHAAAPTHVSALLSGVLIKAGIYGIVRVLSLLPDAAPWWGTTLLVAGVVSAVLGVAFALAQHDVKRLLAYHSIENIGIIAIGIGLALLARSAGMHQAAALALAGGLLHVLNHALFKALLFLGAGAVVQQTGTRSLDALGGLAKAMPVTTLCFVTGAVAIVGLPPLNGFVSEFLIYSSMLHTVASGPGPAWLLAAVAAPALALTGGLALACFAKVVGAVFLGSARSGAAERAVEAPRVMLISTAALALLCAVVGLVPFALAPALAAAGAVLLAVPEAALAAPLRTISALNVGVLALCLAAAGSLAARLARGRRASAVTWDCGYAAPGPRMQYTASSFADLLVRAFALALWPRTHMPRLAAAFPAASSFHSDVPDVVLDRIVLPAARGIARLRRSLRVLQQGSVHAYLLYVWLALVALLVVTGVGG